MSTTDKDTGTQLDRIEKKLDMLILWLRVDEGILDECQKDPGPEVRRRTLAEPEQSAKQIASKEAAGQGGESQTPTRPMADDHLLRLPEVLQRIPVSASTWYRGMTEGRFPQGVKFGPGITAWRKSDIDALVEQGQANRSRDRE